MEFKKEDLLNYDIIKKYLSINSVHDRSQILANVLKKYCFLRAFKKHKVFYRLQKELYYNHSSDKIEDIIICEATLLLDESLKNLTKSKREKLKNDYKIGYLKFI